MNEPASAAGDSSQTLLDDIKNINGVGLEADAGPRAEASTPGGERVRLGEAELFAYVAARGPGVTVDGSHFQQTVDYVGAVARNFALLQQ